MASPLRLLLALFTALMFVFQGFIAQTHLHMESSASGHDSDHAIERMVFGPLDQKPGHELPRHQDSASCPICQQIHAAGAFLAPGASFLLVPLIGYEIRSAFAVLQSAIVVISHDWHGRAPPTPN